MRTPLVAGNWKMNLTPQAAAALAKAIREQAGQISDVEVLLCPPSVYIGQVSEAVRGSAVAVGGQNLYWEAEGAFTGEISGAMLKELGCTYCIVGHSERRHNFGETSEDVNRKVKAALRHGLKPILCVGETRAEREARNTESVVTSQSTIGWSGLSESEACQLVIAYEPVWAIGTGLVATPQQANEVHQLIRRLFAKQFGGSLASALRILYGGSVKPDNIRGLAAEKEIDGALVGGASLKAGPFIDIIRGCQKQANA